MSKEDALRALVAKMNEPNFPQEFDRHPDIVDKVPGAQEIPQVIAAVKAFHHGAGIEQLLALRGRLGETKVSNDLIAQMV
jgi:hypothetical protein